MRAVRERIAVTAIARIAQFGDTGRTDHGVGSNLRMSSSACALGNVEFAGQVAAIAPGLDAIDPGKRRKFALDTIEKRSNAR